MAKLNQLVYKELGIDTQHEYNAYMHRSCHICNSEGFEALTRIRISHKGKTIVASLNVISSALLQTDEISLSHSAEQSLDVSTGQMLTISHLSPIRSLSYVRSKIFGNELSDEQLGEIIDDIVSGHYSNVHLSAFLTACASNQLTTKEIIGLTKAMIKSGKRMQWMSDIVVDKHCIGGLPGNRTTPIIVAIVCALGLTMPKTSSRAITSPAGTADTMEVLTQVDLTLKQITKVVSDQGGCVVWGGSANLSPADDLLIKVEKALDIDSEGQLIASVLSKKIAAGSTHLIVDIPVGETAKIRTLQAAQNLRREVEKVALVLGLHVDVVVTDGAQPVGRGIGPCLEARDVLAVLRNETEAPSDLKEKALLLSAKLLELSGLENPGDGYEKARKALESGMAYDKFIRICQEQGGFREPELAEYRHKIKADCTGTVTKVNNRTLAKLAKLAGAPNAPSAGVDFFVTLNSEVKKGQTIFEIHAESKGELSYALEYYSKIEIITIEQC
ncbi:MAG: thymidine phosphorylase family protein [Bacteroidia bacterium]|nr:thymidine phosphorylase family protein [Bacteroidia bacterium]